MPVPLDPARLRAAALAAAARGWHVFPLRPDDRPGNADHAKRPAFPDHGADRCTGRVGGRDPRCRDGHTGWEPRATTDPDRIERAWKHTPYGVGIACGPSCLVVIDLDVPKPGFRMPAAWAADGVHDGADVLAVLAERAAQPFPATHTVVTASGGLHLYFRHPPGPLLRNTQGERGGGLGPLIDTRAHGGYVAAAGTTIAGRAYRTMVDAAEPPAGLPILPGWLAGLLRPADPVEPRTVLRDFSSLRRSAYVRGAVARTLDLLAAARAPGRNHALFVAAATLGQLVAGGGLTEAEVVEALTPTARAIGLSERETARTIRSGLLAGARRPRRVA